ncbi:MAG: bifunctional oligoribonuclease/PAP phosphatase NrnA [Lachnospiraceae bacterium]|nr:bifunctional oligoribonuclease/PAP phosphatase NrnA [Lachnospiraceae bacterium]
MNGLIKAIEAADTIAIAGHIRPDGDCIGSCMGLYTYIAANFPGKKVSVYLEDFPEAFSYLKVEGALEKKAEVYDLFISLDCGDAERLGEAEAVLKKAGFVYNVDHHITNTKFGDENYVKVDASSTSQILYTLMEDEKIGYETACALYTGIIYDTGVFKHSNTSEETMRIAGRLMEKGIPFGKIIDGSFYMKTYKQLQIMGRCLMESVRIIDGRCIFSVVSKSVMDLYEAKPSDLDGIIDEMRTTEGVEVAILLSEREPGEFKVSMRSNEVVDVSKIARYFGGGGHVRAAGCSIQGAAFDAINNLTGHIEKQLQENGNQDIAL